MAGKEIKGQINAFLIRKNKNSIEFAPRELCGETNAKYRKKMNRTKSATTIHDLRNRESLFYNI
ncbi:MAG: hypothetical protein ACFFE8_11170 [Candidatus Heimdallarchaeota archaeon]